MRPASHLLLVVLASCAGSPPQPSPEFLEERPLCVLVAPPLGVVDEEGALGLERSLHAWLEHLGYEPMRDAGRSADATLWTSVEDWEDDDQFDGVGRASVTLAVELRSDTTGRTLWTGQGSGLEYEDTDREGSPGEGLLSGLFAGMGEALDVGTGPSEEMERAIASALGNLFAGFPAALDRDESR